MFKHQSLNIVLLVKIFFPHLSGWHRSTLEDFNWNLRIQKGFGYLQITSF
jgi:hypothetical protein